MSTNVSRSDGLSNSDVEIEVQTAPHAPGKIHVLQLTFGMGIGGMERVIMDLCRSVDPERYRFSICCLSVRGSLADTMESEGVPVHFCRNQSRLAKLFRGLELSRLFPKRDIQVLHTHNLTALIDGTIGAKLTGVPVLIHTDHSKLYPIPRRWALLERAASMTADAVVAVSAQTRDDLIRYHKISEAKLSVIYNGVSVRTTRTATLRELRDEVGIPEGCKVIGVVARLEDQKGLDLLLRAAPHVLARRPDARFLIVGGGSREGTLRELAAELGIVPQVIFTGWRGDAVDLMQMFDCFALTSVYEGMPISLLEAMSLAKPIVSTSVGGVPEFVRQGENGILVSSRDPHEIADALLRVMVDEEGARLGNNGRLLYQTHYTSEAMARSYAALYEKHLTKKGIRTG